MKKIRQPRTFNELKADPRVEDCYKEEGYANSMDTWVYLKTGWKSPTDPVGNLHTLHEATVSEVCRQVHEALPCDCVDCVNDLAIEKEENQ